VTLAFVYTSYQLHITPVISYRRLSQIDTCPYKLLTSKPTRRHQGQLFALPTLQPRHCQNLSIWYHRSTNIERDIAPWTSSSTSRETDTTNINSGTRHHYSHRPPPFHRRHLFVLLCVSSRRSSKSLARLTASWPQLGITPRPHVAPPATPTTLFGFYFTQAWTTMQSSLWESDVANSTHMIDSRQVSVSWKRLVDIMSMVV
jgi:hypothetical protein